MLGFGGRIVGCLLSFVFILTIHEISCKECYVCRSHAEGQYYPHCPMEGSVNPHITWKENCTGHCFTRTDDLDKELVYRGCVDSQWGLPDPLPPDGCYTYYLEVWCICDGNLCNGAALGKPKNVEFDAHIPKKKKKPEASSSTVLSMNIVTIMLSTSLTAVLAKLFFNRTCIF